MELSKEEKDLLLTILFEYCVSPGHTKEEVQKAQSLIEKVF